MDIETLVLIALGLSLLGFLVGMIADWDERFVGGCLITFIVMFIVVLVMAINQDVQKKTRLMAQCMEDGKKEYECESMLAKPRSSVVPMPVIIPVR